MYRYTCTPVHIYHQYQEWAGQSLSRSYDLGDSPVVGGGVTHDGDHGDETGVAPESCSGTRTAHNYIHTYGTLNH